MMGRMLCGIIVSKYCKNRYWESRIVGFPLRVGACKHILTLLGDFEIALS